MRDDRERLLDIQEAIERIEKYAVRGRESFENDELVQNWMIRHLQIIGEAVSRLPQDFRKRYPDTPLGEDYRDAEHPCPQLFWN